MSADHARAVGSALPAQPTPRRNPRPGRHLRPIAPPTRRRSPAVPVLVGTGIVLTALFALAVMHALLIGGQIRTDDVQRAVASETEEVHRLRLRVAELESPDRVLEVARDRLGMVPPTEVGYLLPTSVDTGDDTLVRVEPAETPASDETIDLGTISADGSGDDDAADDATDDATEEAAEEAADDAAPGAGVDPATTPGVAADGTVAETLEPAE